MPEFNISIIENPELDEEYLLQILAPPNVPQHKIRFEANGSALRGQHETEHRNQEMLDLQRNGRNISWKAYCGSKGDELFIFQMRLFFGGVMLGIAKRIDADGYQPESPVMCKSMKPSEPVRSG